MKEIDYWLEDTDDESKLPPYDDEVIALEAIKADDDKSVLKKGEVIGYRICFAHRVDPKGWAIAFGKGGWNIDIVLWHPAPKLPPKYVIY